MVKRYILLTLLATICVWLSGVQTVGADEGKWKFELTPYLWASAADIDAATINGRTASAELEFDDLFGALDLAGMIRFEAKRDRLGLILDIIYFDLGADGQIEARNGTILKIDGDYKQSNVDLAASYRFDMASPASGIHWWVEPYIGLRYAYLKQELDLTVDFANFGEPQRILGGDEEWLEPFFGGRITMQVHERLQVLLRGDFGGFGIGSDLTWNVLGGVDYRPWKRFSFKLGYRVYGIDYETGSGNDRFGLDSTLHGPVLGATIHF